MALYKDKKDKNKKNKAKRQAKRGGSPKPPKTGLKRNRPTKRAEGSTATRKVRSGR